MAEESVHSSFAGFARLVRGSSVGTVATGLALGGHTFAGATAPRPAHILATALIATIPAVAMSRHEWTARRLLAALLICQAGFHLAFMAVTPDHHTANPLAMGGWHIAATVISVALLRYAEFALTALVEGVALRRATAAFSHSLKLPDRMRHLTSLLHLSVGPSWQRSLTALRGPPVTS